MVGLDLLESSLILQKGLSMRIRLLIMITGLATVAVATPASATFKGPAGRYAFDAYEGYPSAPAVYVSDSHGKSRQRVLRNASAMGWSRDGTRILMIVRTSTLNSLWVAKWNGTGLSRIALSPTIARNLIDHAAWAPDGRHIAFSFAQAGRSVIYTMRTDGKELKRIAVNADWPTWSGSGLIGFRLMPKNNTYLARGLAVMRSDGTHVATLTTGPDSRPSYSPDGKRLLFNRLVPGPKYASNDPAVVTVASRRVSMIKLPPAYHPDDLDRSSGPLQPVGPEWAPSGTMFYSYGYGDVNANQHTIVMGLSPNGTGAHRLFEIIVPTTPSTNWSTGYFYQGTHR